MVAPVPLPAPAPRALLDRDRRPRRGIGRRAGLPARHRRHHEPGGRRRRPGRARPPHRRPRRALPRPGRRQLRPDLAARRRRRARRRPAPRRAVRAPRHALARLLRPAPRRRARLAAHERRDARAHDAHPDDHQPPVVGHRAGRLRRHPVRPEPDAPARRAAAGARPHRGGGGLRAAAPAREHAGPGHDRPQHDDRRGGAVRHPDRQELRPRGLGAPPLRRGPAGRRRRRVAAGPLAGRLRGPHGAPRLRVDRRPPLVHGPPGDRGHPGRRHAHRVPALRRRHRGEPRHDRGAVRAVPRGNRRRPARVRDRRHAARRSSTRRALFRSGGSRGGSSSPA